MARPIRCRRVGSLPPCAVFKPAGIPSKFLDEVALTVDEYEAVRLADLKGMYQEKAATQMRVSRQTFGRIVESARKKITDALVNGKALRIEGGEFSAPKSREFRCEKCDHAWTVPGGTGRPPKCPACDGKDFHREDDGRGAAAKGAGCGKRGAPIVK